MTILQMMVGANISSEQVSTFLLSASITKLFIKIHFQLQSIADRTIVEADLDHDGKISLEEFKTAMEKTEIEQKMSIRFLH